MRKWERMLSSGNALERVRAKQFIEITDGMEPLAENDIDLVNRVFDHCIYYNTGDTEYHFLDGTIITVHTKSERNKSYFRRISKR